MLLDLCLWQERVIYRKKISFDLTLYLLKVSLIRPNQNSLMEIGGNVVMKIF